VLRLAGHLALGDIPAVDRDLEAYARLAAELRQPQHLWHVPLLRGMRAMIDGRFEAAEEFAAEVRAGGERAQEPLAQQFFTIQAALRSASRAGWTRSLRRSSSLPRATRRSWPGGLPRR